MLIFISSMVVAGLLFSNSLSAQTLPHLAPGKPAGVKQAGITSERREVTVIVGVTLVSAGLAVALIGDKGSSAPTATTP